MIRLHVLHYEVGRLPSLKGGSEIVKPVVAPPDVDCIHYGGFLVLDEIGVVGNASGDWILAFKQVEVIVLGAYEPYVGSDVSHGRLWIGSHTCFCCFDAKLINLRETSVSFSGLSWTKRAFHNIC